jgi:signal transduction histidine kinase
MHAQEREATARKRAEEAEERRRAQELLIDVTSHELRQPVSAILNCSALVKANLTNLRDELGAANKENKPFYPSDDLLSLIDEDLEALDSIYQVFGYFVVFQNVVLKLS